MKKIVLFCFLLAIFSFSCKVEQKNSANIPTKTEIFGLASPINLNVDSTKIILNDYFDDYKKIDSIKCNDNLSYSFSANKSSIMLKVKSDSLPKLSVLNVFAKGYKYSFLLKKSRKIKYKFIFDPHNISYKSVKLMGEINEWNPENTRLKFDNGVWTTIIYAEPGKYQYLLVVDDKQELDPNNKDSISNNMGGFNSVMKIGKSEKTETPFIFSIAHTYVKIIIGSNEKLHDLIVFYQNYQLPRSYIKIKKTSIEITIPEIAKDTERSYIRIWASNKNGFSNDMKIPLNFGQVIDNASDLTRRDYEAAVIYNVFIDRFFDGNKKNDRPINNPKLVNPKVDFMGGDIAGVIKKVESGFFDSLGINTIWLSPIVKNVEGAWGHWSNPKTKFSAYHGYWPVSLNRIDDRFGTSAEFSNLVHLIHQKDDNIILDFIAHHVHKLAPLYQKHKNWATNLYLPNGKLNTQLWDSHRLTTWFDTFLPTLDNSRPEVYNLVSDSAVFWIQKYGIDGFRHDAAKHVPLIFWRTLTKKLKTRVEEPEKIKLYQIGETYGTPELISSYVNTGMLNAQFDFNVYDAISTALAVGKSFKNVENQLKTSFKYYGNHNLMGNITGNQDRGRFISYAGGALKYDEDAKVAGWTRDVEVGNDTAYRKSAMLFAFITTIPGIPVIYYGDEIGMPGANDPDNRRMMQFDNLKPKQIQLRNVAEKLIKFRRNSMPLIFGDFKFIFVNKNIMAYQRTYFGQIVIVVFNNSNKSKNLSLKLSRNFNYRDMTPLFQSQFSLKNNILKVKIPASSFDIFYK